MCPNIQFSLSEDAYIEMSRRAKLLGVSANRLGKGVVVEWMRTVPDLTLEEQAALLSALSPQLPEG